MLTNRENKIEFERELTISDEGRKFKEEVDQKLKDNYSCLINHSEDFFKNNKYFAEPFTGYQNIYQENSNDGNTDSDGTDTQNDTQENLDKERNVRDGQRKDFEAKLDTFSEIVFLIHGESGIGKSTYAHKLAYDRKDKCSFHFLNFENYELALQLNRKMLNALSEKMEDNDEYFSEHTLWKIVSIILNQIFLMLEKPAENGNYYLKDFMGSGSYIEKLKLISDTYKNIFVERNQYKETQGTDIDILQKLFSSFSEETEDEVANCLIEHLESFFNNSSEDHAFFVVVGFLFRLYCCIYDNCEERRPYVCVFDNLEFFVRFYNGMVGGASQTDMIRVFKAFDKIIATSKEFLKSVKEKRDWERNPFCFIVVARDSTEAFWEKRNSHLTNEGTVINISGWYCIDTIYQKRLLGQEDSSEYWKAFRNILRDRSEYKWSLYRVLNKMYNFSIRRVSRMLSKALAQISVNDIKYFNEQWNKAFSQENCSENHSCRYMCRQYVFSLLLKNIDDDYIFSLNPQKRELSSESNLARRVLLYLYNVSLERDIKQILFTELVKAVLTEYSQEEFTEKFNELTTVLYRLNERDWQKSGWSALVHVEDGESHVYYEAIFKEQLKYEWQNSTKRFKVKITASGSFFASFISEFEYFSRGLTEHKIKNGKEVLCGSYAYSLWELAKNDKQNCANVIKTIRERINKEIKDLIKDANKIFRTHTVPPGVNPFNKMYKKTSCFCYGSTVYPLEVLRRTIFYTHLYLTFLENSIRDFGFTNEEIQKIRTELAYFLCDAIELVKNHPQYFKGAILFRSDSFRSDAELITYLINHKSTFVENDFVLQKKIKELLE